MREKYEMSIAPHPSPPVSHRSGVSPHCPNVARPLAIYATAAIVPDAMRALDI